MKKILSLSLLCILTGFTSGLSYAKENQIPVATTKSVKIDEDVETSVKLEYKDVESGTETSCQVSNPSFINLKLNACSCVDGVCHAVIRSKKNYNKEAFFDYTVTAKGKVSNIAKVTVNIKGVNDAPIAQSQSVSLDEDTQKEIQLIATDVDAKKLLKYSTATLPSNGRLIEIGVGKGKFIYEPNPNFHGIDSFTFKAADRKSVSLESSEAKISIIVNPIDDAPVAKAKSANFSEDVSKSVLLVYEDMDGDIASSCQVLNPLNIKIKDILCSCNTNNTKGKCQAQIIGKNNFKGEASFDYTVTAKGKVSNIAKVTVNIKGVNDAPIAQSQSVSLDEDTQKEIQLIATDVDAKKLLKYSTATLPSNGRLIEIGVGKGKFIYEPNPNFHGIDSFTFKAADRKSVSLESSEAKISIIVNPIDDAPVATTKSVKIDEDVETSVKLNYKDVESGTATSCQVSNPSFIKLKPKACSCVDGVCHAVIRSEKNYNKDEAFFDYTVTIKKSVSSLARVKVNINRVNDAPVAQSQTVVMDAGGEKEIQLVATDVETKKIKRFSYHLVDPPKNGKLTLINDNDIGKYSYVPDPNFSGEDSFSFKAADHRSLLSKVAALVKIKVIPTFPETLAIQFKDDSSTSVVISKSAHMKEMYMSNEPINPTIDTVINKTPSTILEVASINFFNLVPKDGTIRLGMYNFTVSKPANALKNAADRGAKIKAVLDGSLSAKELIALKPFNNNNNIEVVFCKKDELPLPTDPLDPLFDKKRSSCLGYGINHNKFFTIDKLCKYELDTSAKNLNGCFRPDGLGVDEKEYYENVVVQMTHNFTEVQRDAHNIGMAYFSRPNIYSAYSEYLDNLFILGKKVDTVYLDYHLTKTATKDNSKVTVNFFPKSIDKGDVVLNQLNSIDLSKEKRQSCSIKIAMGHWKGVIGAAIIKKLGDLSQKGCNVDIILAKSISTAEGSRYCDAALMLNALSSEKFRVATYPSNYNGNIHAKYMLIDAFHKKEENPRKTVSYGSLNFTDGAHYHNDETWLTITNSENSKIYEAFSKSFEKMKKVIIDIPVKNSSMCTPSITTVLDNNEELE